MTTDFRALCVELTDCLEKADWPLRHRYVFRQWIDIALAALADEPAVPTVMEIVELSSEIEAAGLGQVDFARAVLTRWGNPAPQPPAKGEVAELEAWLRSTGEGQPCLSDEGYARLTRAAELLQQWQVMVPVSVSDALIKAECALSDIAEGEPMTDEGDPLQWAERRCADTLAIIRPTMRQHKIRTSEWPPLPLPEVK